MKLQGRLTHVAELSSADVRRMLTLMEQHYDGVDPAQFRTDLAEKDWVIEVIDPVTRRLCGFSTQMLFATTLDGRRLRALFSGDTVVDRQHWGDRALSQIWGRLALALIDRYDDCELYWFLISKGYRTYRFLPLFFHEFYPRHGTPTPVEMQRIIAALARHKFDGRFDLDHGVLRATEEQYCLRAELAEAGDRPLHDAHVRFFIERNPGYAQGDELCCVAPLSRRNFSPAAYRVIRPEECGLEVAEWLSSNG